MRYTVCLAIVLLCSSAFARGNTPPSSIKVVINTIQGDNAAMRHNGTFTLTGKNGSDPKSTWTYIYQDRPTNPTIQWSIDITPLDEITVIAGSGQFPAGVWATNGDIFSIMDAPQVTPKNVNTTVTIKASP